MLPLPFARVYDELNCGNGGHAEAVLEEEATVRDEDACAVVNTGEEIGVSVGVDVFVPSTGTETLLLPFSLVTPPLMGISIDNDEDADTDPPFFLFPLPPALTSFASRSSFSSCLLFKAFRLDSSNMAADVAAVGVDVNGTRADGEGKSVAGAKVGEDELFHNGPSLLASAANVFVESTFSGHRNHSSGGSKRVLRLRKKTKE